MLAINEVKSAPTKQLIATYNELSGGAPIKKFKDRATAESRVTNLLRKAAPAKVRVVKGKATANAVGRPRATFKITATPDSAKGRLNKNSLRTQVMDFLSTRPNGTASVDEVNEKFGRQMAGVIQKLLFVNYVKRQDV